MKITTIALLLTSTAAGTALAQANSAPATDKSLLLEEVIVTAQRRNESIQNTSLAVTALSGEALRERGIRDLQDLQNVSPAFSFADAGILKFANIRGVGLNLQSPTVVSGVAVYRDGLFSPSPIFLNEGIFDLASVEVLRGPQGTFVGQNSTGGAIIQQSASPELDTYAGNIETSVGNYGMIKTEGGVSFPLSDTLAMRVAGMIEERDSFFDNTGPGGDKPGRVRGRHGRVSLLWEPNSNLSTLLKVEVNDGDNGGYASQPIPGTRYAALDPADEFTMTYDRADTKREEYSNRTSLEVNYTFDNDIVLRSITGYQYGTQDFINDLDASSAPDNWQHQKIKDYVYSQEINVISPETGAFKWVVGGSYVKQVANLWLHIYDASFPFDGSVFTTQDVFIDTENPKTAMGLFAQATYDLTNNLTLEVGTRFSRDKQTQSGGLTLSPTPPLPGFLDGSNPKYDDDQWTGKVSLNWHVTPDNMIYGFIANGFKAGGVNLPDGIFLPEKIIDYEFGWKSTAFDGALRTQLNAFYMDYEDLQLEIFNPYTTTTSVANAGKSEIYGVEMQAQAQFGGLGVNASLAYVHSEVGTLSLIDERSLPGGSSNGLGIQCPSGTPSNPPVCFDYAPYSVDLDGQQNPFSPEWTANLGVDYTFVMQDGRQLIPRMDIAYQASQTTNLFARPVLDTLASRTLVNAELRYDTGSWWVAAYGTNLTDETYRIGNSTDTTFYGAPRQYGIKLGGSF